MALVVVRLKYVEQMYSYKIHNNNYNKVFNITLSDWEYKSTTLYDNMPSST